MIVTQGKRFNLSSRSLVNILDENGFLPIITAPMYSVCGKKESEDFLSKTIQVCLPRGDVFNKRGPGKWESYSLSDFEKYYCNDSIKFNEQHRVCIDVANGNMRSLHIAIGKCKHLHGDKVEIISGNISSVEAFLELARTGIDYIRIGIGGSSVCNTFTQTGVGQADLEDLITDCYSEKVQRQIDLEKGLYIDEIERKNWENISKVKIIADGISRQMQKLIEKNEAVDNGYALICRLLFSGADLVMIGRLFAQSLESAGEKRNNNTEVDYYGMSTKRAQAKYSTRSDKASEGNSQWLPVKWTLNQWLEGDENRSDYLSGFKKALQSSISYSGHQDIKDFKFYKP